MKSPIEIMQRRPISDGCCCMQGNCCCLQARIVNYRHALTGSLGFWQTIHLLHGTVVAVLRIHAGVYLGRDLVHEFLQTERSWLLARASEHYLASASIPKRGQGLADYDLIAFTGAPAATSPIFMVESLEVRGSRFAATSRSSRFEPRRAMWASSKPRPLTGSPV